MDVFLAGIIQGSKIEAKIHDQDWRGPIKAAIARSLPTANVYCHYGQHPRSITYELPDIRETLADGNRRAAACDLLVAYIPSASMGTAIEMYEAARAGATVVAITPMNANWIVRAYADRILPDIDSFERFAASGELQRLTEAKAKSPR